MINCDCLDDKCQTFLVCRSTIHKRVEQVYTKPPNHDKLHIYQRGISRRMPIGATRSAIETETILPATVLCFLSRTCDCTTPLKRRMVLHLFKLVITRIRREYSMLPFVRSLLVGCVAQWLERWSLTGELSCPTLDLCSWQVTSYVGKPPAIGQPTRPTQPFVLRISINWVVSYIRCVPPRSGGAIWWMLTE